VIGKTSFSRCKSYSARSVGRLEGFQDAKHLLEPSDDVLNRLLPHQAERQQIDGLGMLHLGARLLRILLLRLRDVWRGRRQRELWNDGLGCLLLLLLLLQRGCWDLWGLQEGKKLNFNPIIRDQSPFFLHEPVA
jgi:hypothetical protein